MADERREWRQGPLPHGGRGVTAPPALGRVLRRADYSLSDEQRALRETFAALLARECPGERVRKAEPLGFDEELWRRLGGLQVVGLGVPETSGGQGAGLVELVLVAEQMGRYLAPVPFVEAVVVARLLARCGGPGATWLHAMLQLSGLVTLALQRAENGPQLLPAGAIADAAVGLAGGELVLVTPAGEPPGAVGNLGGLPLGNWDLTGPVASRTVLLDGPAAVDAYELTRREWQLLTAAAQLGVAEGALTLAVRYAGERHAFGGPIARFQAVSHPLADAHIAIVGARRLVWKAAWFADHEPGVEPQLIPMASVHAAETAAFATSTGIHTLGGIGFTTESDMQLFFRRAKGWANVGGGPAAGLELVADALYGPAGT